MADTARSTSRRRSSSTASRLYPPDEAAELAKETTTVSVRRDRSRPTSGSASTRATPTRWSAARSSCRTAPARSSASPSSPRARRPRRRCAPAPTRSAARTSSRRSRPAGSSSTSRSRRPDIDGPWSAGSARSSAAAASMPNPKAGHDHVRPRARDPRGQGRPRRVQGRQGRRSSTSPVGKASFEADALVANLAALVDAINRAKPAGAKGQYLRTLTIASTMGPGIRVDIPGVLAAAAAA